LRVHQFIVYAKNLRPIEWALGASLLLHGVLLSIKFQVPERFDRFVQNTEFPLILVNIRLKADENLKAQAVAQTNLDGGGEEQSGRMSSPLQNSARTVESADSEDVYRDEAEIKALAVQQNKLLAQVRLQVAELNLTQPDPTNLEQESKRRRLLKLMAEIEAKVELTNKRPHKRFFSPSTKESAFALYFDEMKRKIESYGTRNFPSTGGVKLYGALTMAVTVNSLGQILSVEVIEGSGFSTLDRRAQAIVFSSGPFSIFSHDLSAKADQISLISKFTFSPDGTLNTEIQTPQRP
jgi:protein TonB